MSSADGLSLNATVTTTWEVTTNASLEECADNPWQDTQQGHKIIEVIYMTMVVILGTIGNLTVIFSIIFEQRVFANGNIFVINLAIADLLVTGFVVPTVIANVLLGDNALPHPACQLVGYVVTVTCTCSLSTLTLIAVNRYWAVVHSSKYRKIFSHRRVYLMVLGAWVWSNGVSMPTLVGWSSVGYDCKMMLCTWNDYNPKPNFLSYRIFLTSCAIFIPLCIIAYCYYRLFSTVQTSGRWVRSLSVSSGVQVNSEQHRRSERKERNLLQTLATTVAFFCICWLPYAFCIMINPQGTPALWKKIFGWMGLSNSALNFVIYGAMNRVYRRGYTNLYVAIFTCKRKIKITSTNRIGSIHSDSFYRSQTRRKSSPGMNNARIAVNLKNSPLSAKHSFQAVSVNSIETRVYNTTPKMRIKKSQVREPSPLLRRPVAALAYESKKTFQPALASIKRPGSNVTKREKRANEKKNEAAEREARLKRNSLMLLQIQMGDSDEDSAPEMRRTHSEIPNGVHRPVVKSIDLKTESVSANNNSNSNNCGPLWGRFVPSPNYIIQWDGRDDTIEMSLKRSANEPVADDTASARSDSTCEAER